MKTKQLFWGVLFLTLGVLYLMVEVMHINFALSGFYHYWPLSLIFIGLTVLSKNTYVKLTLSGLAGIVIALVIFSFFSKSWFSWNDCDDEVHSISKTEQFIEPFDTKVKTVDAVFKLGAGKIIVGGNDSNLVSVNSGGMKNMFSVETNKNDDAYAFDISMKDVNIKLDEKIHRILQVGLNNKPNYSFDFELGAADVTLDLSPLKVEKIDLSSGAASCTMKVKEFATDNMNIKIEAGAASVRLIIPKDAGAQIKRETAFATTQFDTFKEISDDLFQTENFASAKKKIFIEIDGGVASFFVSRN